MLQSCWVRRVYFKCWKSQGYWGDTERLERCHTPRQSLKEKQSAGEELHAPGNDEIVHKLFSRCFCIVVIVVNGSLKSSKMQ